ncbi:MAG: lysophospholipid acyltransferase family protein [Gemmatimonadota bacterium]|nr:lysophospholipid acyltransferase family protein [Gemmatimonadota bacterium]
MLYEILRVTAQHALRWYYSELIVQGRENIPVDGPLLVVANHSNALVDALLVGTIIPRRVLVTARATLFDGRALAGLLRRIGVVPLLRDQDVVASADAPARLTRNDTSLEQVTEALRLGEGVLIFPEGISHDRPTMAPLKSGAARIALQALGKGARTLNILPVGLVYEEKERPGTRVLVTIGKPIHVDLWLADDSSRSAVALTQAIARALRRVTLDSATGERAVRSIRFAHALSLLRGTSVAIARETTPSDDAPSMVPVDTATEALERAPATLQARAEELIGELQHLEECLAQRGMTIEDAIVPMRTNRRLLLMGREAAVAYMLLPLVLLGRGTHWIPLQAARMVALYSLRSDPSRDQPAMRTILIGILAIPAWYVIQAAFITLVASALPAVSWISACFVGAVVDARYRGRIERAIQRARAYFSARSEQHMPDSLAEASRELLQRATVLGDALLQVRTHSP